ncbi:Secretion protein HlyD family protein [uncultured Paludibacter sp.]|uniref:Secretion protein HlyD family protein n=1 Tax=uncultured Paludibacter sp. TaxID=497635 RepID=A0A653A605_9BACT|nr:Secretion protein HlyD family protein [uncultured Paludibacter sp.]
MTKKKNFKIYLPVILIVIAVIGGSIYWYIDYKKYIKTDDAYITSDITTISPKIMGRIAKDYVEEGDSVKQGQLVAELDSADLLAQKQQVLASKLQTVSGKTQAEAKYQFDTKNIDVLRIGLERAKEDLDRAKTQFAGGVATKEQFDHFKKAYETAEAQYEASKAQLAVSKSQIESAQAAISSSDAQINLINTQLKNTRIYAPDNGVIAKRWLLPGDIANAGQSIFTLNNDSRFWVNVFLEETKMEKLHIGEKVLFTLDMYPDVTFQGNIFEIGSTTASQFSLIPPSNASGNFTKVTQRIPLKVSIDQVEKGKKLSDYHLTTGMSAVVKIVR